MKRKKPTTRNKKVKSIKLTEERIRQIVREEMDNEESKDFMQAEVQLILKGKVIAKGGLIESLQINDRGNFYNPSNRMELKAIFP